MGDMPDETDLLRRIEELLELSIYGILLQDKACLRAIISRAEAYKKNHGIKDDSKAEKPYTVLDELEAGMALQQMHAEDTKKLVESIANIGPLFAFAAYLKDERCQAVVKNAVKAFHNGIWFKQREG